MQPERFSASVAGRHMACHASANLPLAIPNWVPPVRDETVGRKAVGTNYHKMLADIAVLPAKDIAAFAKALEYVAEIRSRRRFKVLAEVKTKATWLQKEPQTTADLVLYTQDELHIIDWKTGKIEVEAENNEQLLFGAVSYAELAPKADGAHLHIVQPWAGGNSHWFASAEVLTQFMEDAIATEDAILKGDVSFGPSDHCTFCPANPHSRGDKGRPLCPVMMEMLYPRTGVDEDAVLNL